ERHAVFVAKIVDDNNVGVLKNARLRLAIEALQHLRLAGKSLRESFDRHLPADSPVFGAIDHSHAAAAQDARDLVLADLLFYGCRIHNFRQSQRASRACPRRKSQKTRSADPGRNSNARWILAGPAR